ncbi:MAG TPA: hypothetical protein VMW79_07765 [Anaerolineae bacterium]|nr:hypothetical protein [Anaerolineae bacterium]
MIDVYEVASPSIPDLDLEEQIAAGCNDWIAEVEGGAVFFGRTEAEAREQAERWELGREA